MPLSSLFVIFLGIPAWSSTDTVQSPQQTLVMPADDSTAAAKEGSETLVMPAESETPPPSKETGSETLVMPEDRESPREASSKPAAGLDPAEEALDLVERMRADLDALAAALRDGGKLKPDAGAALKEMDRDLKALVDPQGITASVAGIGQSLAVLSAGLADAEASEQRHAVSALRRMDQRLQSLLRTEAPSSSREEGQRASRTAAPEPQREQDPAMTSLSAVRSALAVYYGDTEGTYPEDLKKLAENGKYLAELPSIDVGGHGRTASVKVLAQVREWEDLETQVADTGGWLYVGDKTSPLFGTVLIDCTHMDPQGVQWYRH